MLDLERSCLLDGKSLLIVSNNIDLIDVTFSLKFFLLFPSHTDTFLAWIRVILRLLKK